MAKIIQITSEEAKRRLSNVLEEYIFWCCDGSIFRNMRDLEDGLYRMSDDTFACHSNTDKKDFSNWVNDVIKDDKLARDLAKARNRDEAAKFVSDRITFLSSKMYKM
jgi:hypothetical protein